MGHYREEVLKELRREGNNYKNVDEIFNQKQLNPTEVKTILKWLPFLYLENVATADTLVRSLMAAKEPFDPSLLIGLFENSELNHYLKSGIAFTLACAKTTDIAEWMKDQLLNKDFSSAKHGLISGLYEKGGFKDDKELMAFLKKIFDKYHNDTVLKLFKKYGDSDDFAFLENKAETSNEKLAKEIKKVLKNKRIE